MAKYVVIYTEHHPSGIADHLRSFDTAAQALAEIDAVRQNGWDLTEIRKDGKTIDEAQLLRDAGRR